MIVTKPGVYDDMPNEVYHGDPVPAELGGSLSSSGARKLLPPNSPARFRYDQDNPPTSTDAYTFGHAAHRMVLGAGQEIVHVEANDWRTKAAQQQKKEALAAGQVPLLTHELEVVTEMADAIRRHPVASLLFGSGKPEQSLFWVDEDTGVWRRARLDWLPERSGSHGRLIIPDYKTTKSAAPADIEKAIYDYGYHQQADWYLDGVRAVLGETDPVFLFVFQEKAPPYLVTVAQPDAMALRIGRHYNRLAINTYRRCVADSSWPGYSDGVELVGVPRWAEIRYLEEIA